MAFRYLGESLSPTIAGQIRVYGLAAIGGLAAAGSLRAAQLLLGPVNSAIMGIAMMAVRESAVLLRVAAPTAAVSCCSAAWGRGVLAWGMGSGCCPIPWSADPDSAC